MEKVIITVGKEKLVMTTYRIETKNAHGDWDAYGLGGPDVQTFASEADARAALTSCADNGLLEKFCDVRCVELVDGRRQGVVWYY